MSWVFTNSQYLHEKYLTWKIYLIWSALCHSLLVSQKYFFCPSFGQKNAELHLLFCFLEKEVFCQKFLFITVDVCLSLWFQAGIPLTLRGLAVWTASFHAKQMHMWKDIQLHLREAEELKQRNEHLTCTICKRRKKIRLLHGGNEQKKMKIWDIEDLQ